MKALLIALTLLALPVVARAQVLPLGTCLLLHSPTATKCMFQSSYGWREIALVYCENKLNGAQTMWNPCRTVGEYCRACDPLVCGLLYDPPCSWW